MADEPDLKRNPAYGPYLNAAFLCEKILEEKSGVLSAIRIIDRVTYTYKASPENPSSGEPPCSSCTFVSSYPEVRPKPWSNQHQNSSQKTG